MSRNTISATVEVTQAYYDGPADEIYRTIWGDNIHMGIAPEPGASLHESMDNTNRIMAEAAGLRPGDRVLDLGCGYGSTARYIANRYGCEVIGTNISENELELATQRARESGLDHLLTFEYGDFHDIDHSGSSFDVVWSQEAFLHGADKDRILRECHRALKPGGTFIFSDILVRRSTPLADRERLYDRLKTTDIWDLPDYRDGLEANGFEILNVEDHSEWVAPTYGAVVEQVREHRSALANRIGGETVDRTIDALDFWVHSANDSKVGWGIFLARKPN